MKTPKFGDRKVFVVPSDVVHDRGWGHGPGQYKTVSWTCIPGSVYLIGHLSEGYMSVFECVSVGVINSKAVCSLWKEVIDAEHNS